jgi:hypothetical protein
LTIIIINSNFFLYFHVLVMKVYVFKNNLNVFQINYQNNFLHIFKYKLWIYILGFRVLLMSLQMLIKRNQYYHIYHMMVQQYVFLEWHLEYKSFYMLGNVRSSMVMVSLQNLIETILPFIINGQVCLICIWIQNFKFLLIIMHHLIILVMITNKYIIHQ